MGPDDIELGDDVIEVEKKPRAGVVVSVRLSADEADQLLSIAEMRGTTLSRVAREALGAYILHGPRRPIAVGPWTGTMSSGNLALSFTQVHGEAPQTVGSMARAQTPA